MQHIYIVALVLLYAFATKNLRALMESNGSWLQVWSMKASFSSQRGERPGDCDHQHQHWSDQTEAQHSGEQGETETEECQAKIPGPTLRHRFPFCFHNLQHFVLDSSVHLNIIRSSVKIKYIWNVKYFWHIQDPFILLLCLRFVPLQWLEINT